MPCVALIVEEYLKAQLLEQTNYIENFFDSEIQNIIKITKSLGINRNFNFLYSPHTGGIQDAAVKSLNNHLVRLVGNASMNLEEFITLLIQVEAVFNS